MAEQSFVIAGAGPAGMTLAYVLASNGYKVRVLERHPEFEREFRGELVQASSVSALDKLGVLPALVQRGEAIPNVIRRMFIGPRREVMSALRKHGEQGMVVAQPAFLRFMHEQCSRFAGYQLDMGTTVTEAVTENGRVVAFKTRTASGEGRVDGDVFIATNGRNSVLRSTPGIEAEAFEQPADALWLRFDFSEHPELLPKGVDVYMFGKGVVIALQPTTKHRLQIAYSAPGELGKLRKDTTALKLALVPNVPELIRPIIEAQLDEKTEWQILRIAVDRLKKWHVPGLLFIGDAAHTMSPSGGQGLNVAIRDAVVTANHFVDALKAGRPVDETVFAAIEAERRPEVELAQSGQIRAGKMVMKPIGAIHVLFTMISSLVWLFTGGGRKQQKSTVIEVKHAVEVSRPS